jgi:hypothetical protein
MARVTFHLLLRFQWLACKRVTKLDYLTWRRPLHKNNSARNWIMDNAVSYIYHPRTVCALGSTVSSLERNAEQSRCTFHSSLLVNGAILQAGRWRILFPRSLDFFLIDLILPVALWPWGRSEYQESSWGVERGQWVRLTTLPLSVRRLSRQCGIFQHLRTL